MLEGSVVIIGDELLAGSVNDTNGHLAAGRLRAHGIPLSGVYVVPDDREAIVGILRTELRRPLPRLVLTSGGIGSTPDDITFSALAEALDRELVVVTEEAARLEDEIEDLRARGFEVDDEGSEDILSMVCVPEGGIVLRQGGWVCGVRVDVAGGLDDGGVTIVALPGIPEYFRSALDELVVPQLLEGKGVVQTVEEIEHGLPELVLGPQLRRLGDRWPDCRIGSYPGEPMVVRIFGPPESVDGAIRDLSDVLAELESAAG